MNQVNYTDFNGANKVFMWHILGHYEPIYVKFGVWGFFHHVLLKYCHENAEMQKTKFDDVTLQYSIDLKIMWKWGFSPHLINVLEDWKKFKVITFLSGGGTKNVQSLLVPLGKMGGGTWENQNCPCKTKIYQFLVFCMCEVWNKVFWDNVWLKPKCCLNWWKTVSPPKIFWGQISDGGTSSVSNKGWVSDGGGDWLNFLFYGGFMFVGAEIVSKWTDLTKFLGRWGGWFNPKSSPHTLKHDWTCYFIKLREVWESINHRSWT